MTLFSYKKEKTINGLKINVVPTLKIFFWRRAHIVPTLRKKIFSWAQPFFQKEIEETIVLFQFQYENTEMKLFSPDQSFNSLFHFHESEVLINAHSGHHTIFLLKGAHTSPER